MSVNLQYNYAGINPETGLCDSCITTTYLINHPNWVQVPVMTDDYVGKYYNSIDQLWYLTSDFSQIWEDAPQW